MDNLERRYRRLLRLLPADHRAARGEELLGMLLDLDGTRTSPSLRQAAGVLGLAMRLRLADSASMLLAGFLVAIGTAVSAAVYDLVSGNLTIIGSARWPIIVNMALPNLLRLATAAAWILGARRTALAASGAVLASVLVRTGFGAATTVDLAVLAVLAVAVWSRWPTPRPRIATLATIPFAVLLWILGAIWRRQDGIPVLVGHPHPATWTLTVVGVIGGTIIAGVLARHRSRRATLALLAAGVTIGAITPSVLPSLLYRGLTTGGTLSGISLYVFITLAVALFGASCRAFSKSPTPAPDRGSPASFATND
jgi:hypothetical protein